MCIVDYFVEFIVVNFFYRILYASLHRYDYGYFYPCREDAGPTYTGGDSAIGYNVNIAWNRDVMGDPEYLAAFHHIVMPVAYEVSAKD